MKLRTRFKKIKDWIINHKVLTLCVILIPFITAVSFVKIMDKTVKKRRMPIEYIVIHYTANFSPSADARMNAMYLRNKERAGTHYCIDDEEVVQCTDEGNVAYAVGDRKWFGFIPKPWLHNKILNNNSLSFEMCLGGDRNDSLIMDKTAQFVGWQLVNKGLDISRVVRHYDVSGKHCPWFGYQSGEWDQKKEDRSFIDFKKRVEFYWKIHLDRKKQQKIEQNSK